MNGKGQPLITTCTSLESFFSELVGEAIAAERLDVEPSTSAYLIRLVNDFSRQDALDQTHSDGTLFELYQRATVGGPTQRFEAYRQLGDVALFVSGFFMPHIERSTVSADYYLSMGGNAYRSAAGLADKEPLADLLDELSHCFARLVEVLTRVAERTGLQLSASLASLYDRWLRNAQSPGLQDRLRGAGGIPVFDSKGAA